MSAPGTSLCHRNGCLNRTTHPTGKCYHHRSAEAAPTVRPGTPPAPVPVLVDAPAVGLHPIGGYDEIVEGPARVFYLRDGKAHRTDGPAKIFGTDEIKHREEWWVDGEQHRVGAAAVIHYDGEKAFGETYYEHGKLHRLDGLADYAVSRDGKVSGYYAIRGVRLSEVEHARVVAAIADGAPEEWALAYAEGTSS